MAISPCYAKKPNIDTVVVCAPALLEEAKPWLEYRLRQGHQITLIPENLSYAEIKRDIKAIAKQTDLKFVVLIGDAPRKELARDVCVETAEIKSTVIRKWGAEENFSSDHAYGDLDDDGTPDLVVGRIPASSPSQLTTIVQKTLAYERNRDFGPWRRRVNFVAGIGGFGAFTDKILESAAKKFITDGIPADYQTTMTQASWRSPYSPDPRRFQSETIQRLNEGSLAWVYLGHGLRSQLDYYRLPGGGGLPIFSTREIPKLACQQGHPIAVLLACYACDFASANNQRIGEIPDAKECLGEEMLASPGGPVAVIGGSNVTMPYAMTVLGNGMLQELFEERRKTVGEVLFHAKLALANAPVGEQRGMIDQLAKVLSPDPDLLQEERNEHIRLFQLLGDPLLRIHYPKVITLEVPEYATIGDKVTVSGESPINGECEIELICRRDRLTFKPARRGKFEPTDEWLNSVQATYEKANKHTWYKTTAIVSDNKFSLELPVPAEASGVSHVRAYMRTENDFATGAADTYLRKPPQTSDE